MMRAIFDQLMQFDTVSAKPNIDLMLYVQTLLAEAGISAALIPDVGGAKANLFATLGPEGIGGVMLSGHTDVVPVAGQNWSSDPWSVVERDGRLFGRGVCDMKGFDALALAALPLALQSGVKRPLQIALSYDEELGCTGALPMIRAMAAGLPRAAAVIVGEPSMMKVVTGHKGGHSFRVHMRGHEVHSSLMHEGVSAIMQGARLIDWANRMNAENAARPATELGALFHPHWTTVHVGTITGGTAENITAKDCSFGLGFRVVPGEDPLDWVARLKAEAARIAAEMQAVHPDAGITLEEKFVVTPLVPEQDGVAEALARRLTGDNATRVVSYGTEAGHFQSEGYSTVVCGPGDIAQAHQPDEWLAVSQFEAGWQFMQDVVKDLCQ
ncbi:MAG TPA: acetylornithine deacetylase [Gemmobacter sp.]|nr:acetylornithine deacetylase [Gemmobacter sp.]